MRIYDEGTKGLAMSATDPNEERTTLTAADAAAVDAVLNGEAGADPARKQRVEAWLNVLDNSPMPEPAGDLAARTLAAVQADRMRLPRSEATATAAAKPTRTAGRGAWRRRLAEFGAMAVAAALLLAVTLEGISQAKRANARTLCQANLKTIGGAMGVYANMSVGELPMLAMPANGNWLRGNSEAGQTTAVNNAAHLLPLVTGQYLAITALFCPGAGLPSTPVGVERNALPGIGYSYRNMYGTEKPKWDGLKTTIVLADKNPVFGDIVRPEWDQKNSFNHDGRGTYVLRADDSASWELTPNIGPDHDNIWTLGSGKERPAVYTGREVPANRADVFLCP
jgi:hypothetical protein